MQLSRPHLFVAHQVQRMRSVQHCKASSIQLNPGTRQLQLEAAMLCYALLEGGALKSALRHELQRALSHSCACLHAYTLYIWAAACFESTQYERDALRFVLWHQLQRLLSICERHFICRTCK